MQATTEIIDPPESTDMVVPAIGGNTIQQAQREPSPETMLMLAIERGADVNTLERLVALQERVTAERSRKAWIEAVAKFKEQCPPIMKNRNGHVGRYADLSHISKVIDPHIQACGLSYTWDTEVAGQNIVVTCKVTHVGGHTERSSFTAPVDGGNKATSGPQRVAITVTYSKRQTLVNALGLIVDDDLDGRPEPGQAPNAAPTAPKVAPRGQRTDADPNAVTAAQLNALFQLSKLPTVPEFAAWAKKKLGAEQDMTKVGHWSIDAYNYIEQEIKEGRM